MSDAPDAFVYNATLDRIIDGDTFDCILDLGFDSSGNTRIITANNSVVQDDILFGGGY